MTGRVGDVANRSVILTYHSLDTSNSVISFPPDLFREHMARLAESGAPVVGLPEVCSVPGSIAITFDDAYGSFLSHAMRWLTEYNFPATVFVVSGYCGRTNDWETQPSGIPRMPLMSWDDIRSLPHQRIQIGAHTVNHPDLTRLQDHEIEAELRDCRHQIEDRAGVAVETLAYPYGRCSPGVRAIARGEYRIACGTRMGLAQEASDRWELPRVDAYYLRSRFQPVDLLTPGGRAYVHTRAALRRARSWVARGV